MPRIIKLDLNTETITESLTDYSDYGRGLAVKLLRNNTPDKCSRLGEENAIVIAPGLLAGTNTPCATRMSFVTRSGDSRELAIGNFSGDAPQKLAAAGVGALVINGKSQNRNVVMYIDRNSTSLYRDEDLEGIGCDEIVDRLRTKWGSDCAIIAVGQGGDMGLPMGSCIATYPEGTPRFHCARSTAGDVMGSKGLRAIVINQKMCLSAPVADSTSLSADGRKLARAIIDDPICGGALPGLGSITLLHLLKNREEIPAAPEKRPLVEKSTNSPRINYNCAPMCVIGCLNRHSSNTGEIYAFPEVSEVQAALRNSLGRALDEDAVMKGASAIINKAIFMGLNATEVAFTIAMYIEATGMPESVDSIETLVDELGRGTAIGRIIGGGTKRVCELFRDNEAIQPKMIRPATEMAGQYVLDLKKILPELADLNDFELLYMEIFLMENLGICIFSSFAILNNRDTLELLAKLASDKIGTNISISDLMKYSADCLKFEADIVRKGYTQASSNIPEFVKVLYRYFEK